MDIVAQIGIILFGGGSVWLLGSKSRWQRWGYILGLLGQPFFFYTSLVHEQWGVFAMAVWYTISFGRGFYNYWLLPKDVL